MNGVHEREHVIYGRTGENAVTKVEYVPGPSRGFVEDVFGSLPYLCVTCKQDYRVEVPLYRYVVPDPEALTASVEA